MNSKKGDPKLSETNHVVIELRGVSVQYRIPVEPVSTFKEHVIRRLQGRGPTYRKLWAANNITLSIGQGEAFGIVGANGAGKSTLLKVIAKVIRPTKGRILVRGKVAPLIALGAGFHPELTGRENVYLNGAMLGYSRMEMEERFDRIVDFAELWDFIDAPLGTYSSGMTVRLGFSVATNVDPDIVIVDEVLAVGDQSFQQKCVKRMNSFRESKTTLLFVSHDLNSVAQTCDRAIWIKDGEIAQAGESKSVVNSYKKFASTGQ